MTVVPENPELLLGQYIPLHYHYQMLLDEARMTGFYGAIQHAVKPQSRVLELGGGTGVLSFYAAQIARKVWCVERQPLMVDKAREFLALNPTPGEIDVVLADAFTYLPPEPVDVVICEMLHSALLREKQVAVMQSFKSRYAAKFGPRLPVFLPAATVLSIELVQQDFNFNGYFAPVPMFQAPGRSERLCGLAAPVIYAMLIYEEPFSETYGFNESIVICAEGELNAIRFITTNALVFKVLENSSINWLNQNLIVPLAAPLQVKAGDRVQVCFQYQAGDEIDSLMKGIVVSHTCAD